MSCVRAVLSEQAPDADAQWRISSSGGPSRDPNPSSHISFDHLIWQRQSPWSHDEPYRLDDLIRCCWHDFLVAIPPPARRPSPRSDAGASDAMVYPRFRRPDSF
jgi:hypothetical protein